MPRNRLLLPALLAACAWSGLTQAAPLSFAAALDLAERQSPTLAAQAARLAAARDAAIPADALPDPKLFVGIDNLPVSGDNRYRLTRDFMTMQKLGVMQDVPNAAKRRARTEVAAAAVAREAAQGRIDRLTVRRDTALAWITRYYLERRLALFDDLGRENRLFDDAVRAQLAAGRASAADTVMPRQEAAALADRRDELERDLAKSKAALRRLIGAGGAEPLAGEPPALAVDPTTLRQHLFAHPDLQAFEPMADMADAELHEAQAMKRPDWAVEFAYQRRGREFGDMVSLQFTVDLPLFAAQRQDPLIAAKQRERERVDAEREAMARDHAAELDGDLAEYDALTRQLARLRQDWLPLAAEKVNLQLAAYRAGRANLTDVVAARREVIDQRFRALDLEGQRTALAAKLHYAYGEEHE